jgi:hypothetical protein
MRKKTLVIVPCGRSKIWDKYPRMEECPARRAYIGSPFKVNREYAREFGDAWVILSAKFGFVFPDFKIPGPYEVTFKKPSTCPITVPELKKQIRRLKLDHFDLVIGLGGSDYRKAIQEAFSQFSPTLSFPYAGLSLGVGMGAIKLDINTHREQNKKTSSRGSFGLFA